MILHHYEGSPFSEKIRLMFGYNQISWQSLISPAAPPRPNVTPLVGGYRRIPILQIGADLFCDTRIIATEVAAISGKPELAPANCDEATLEYINNVESDVFFAALGDASPVQMFQAFFRTFGFFGTFKLLKDRAGVAKTSNQQIPSRERAAATFSQFLGELENSLLEQPFIGGSAPNLADFAVWHPLWARKIMLRASIAPEYKQVIAWCHRMEAFGHGQRAEIDQQMAFDAAQAEPRQLPESVGDELLGGDVSIAPTDYAKDPTMGVLVASAPERWIIARKTAEFGLIHVHFPRQGFAITKV